MVSLVLTRVAAADDAADMKITAEAAAYNAGDVDAIATFWLPDTTMFSDNGPLGEAFNKEQVKGQLEAGLNYACFGGKVTWAIPLGGPRVILQQRNQCGEDV